MEKHFLQSKTWEKFQQSNGATTFRLTGEDFEAMAILKTTKLGNYLYCPYGPNVSDKKSLKNALKALQKLASEQNCFFIRIEPAKYFTEKELATLDLQKSRELNPEHTLILDLTQDQAEIFKNMPSRKLRYWRNYTKKGQSIRQTKNPEEISILTSLLQKLGEKNDFIPQDEPYLKKQLEAGFATLYVLDYSEPENENSESRPIAAALVYDDKTTRYYMHAATDDNYAKLSAGPTLLIQLIVDAQQNGQKYFNFWGITTSEDPNHPWYSFTQYKKSYGGTQKDYSGDYDYIINRNKYRAYKLLRGVNRLRRKIKH